MKATVHKIDGSPAGEIELNDNVFNIEPSTSVMHRCVLSYLAAQRQGTHLARNRALVSGSTRKLYRQKGTGRARAGSVKSNILRGGGKSFGPSPHEYHLGVNRKEKQLGRRSAISAKARGNSIMIVEDFGSSERKTKAINEILNAFNFDGSKRAMLVITEHSPELWASCRNIKNLSVFPAKQLNTYQILRQKTLIIQKSAAELMNEVM